MLIYPFHNDDTQSQLPARVGFSFGLASELKKSKGEIMVVEWQIEGRSSEYDWMRMIGWMRMICISEIKRKKEN